MDRALKGLPSQQIPEILVGFDQADDAGVYLLSDSLALVQTVDFFSPIIDDPFAFGQIAAANALSDIYAMGARPLTALSIVGFPEGEAEPEVLRAIIDGGLNKLNECGVALLGGHSVKDEEIKFGYAVTGTVDPARILQNSKARVGDRILLTKRLGTGLIATALKKDQADLAHVEGAIQSMLETNGQAAEIVSRFDVQAMTDVSGFGLVGHAVEVGRASKLTIEIDHRKLPVLDGALDYSSKGHRSGGLSNNREFFSPHVSWKGTVGEDKQDILFDPQTSGGLLILVSESDCSGLIDAIGNVGIAVSEIGVARLLDDTCIHIV